MSNRDMCISVINSMEEWQLQSVLEMLRAVKGTMDKLESEVLETRELLSIPGMGEKLIEGKKTPLKYKYMRIQGREDSYITKYPKGVFSLCWNLIRENQFTDEEKELFISIDNWFKDNLPEPEPCKNRERVITFFKCETTSEMVERLKPAIALLDKYQKPYDVVYTNFVGTILYEDILTTDKMCSMS